ncbi:MAG: endonuclease/exonuclease/phosphatase family protein [Candidatus Hydrogenedentes bacterium]|nr:endonuclease/exonuclease/phosphatase family protein [Candidatus Hydrogenedentota bacterium]
MKAKRLLKRLVAAAFLAAVALVAAVAALFFWASSGNLSAEDYERGFLWESADIAKADAAGPYTIVTYNIGYGSGLTNMSGHNASEAEYEENMGLIVAALVPREPDFVACQEIDYGGHRSYGVDQLAVLAGGLGLRHGAKALTWDMKYLPFPYWPPSENFGKMVSGQAVASRYPITAHSKVTLPRPPDNPFWYDRFYLDRIVQIVEVEVGASRLVLMNVHLEAHDRLTCIEHCRILADLARDYMDTPLIVLGDFNARAPWTKGGAEGGGLDAILAVENLHKAIPKEAYERDGEEVYYTASSNHPRQSIDHIFYNDKIRWLSAAVLQDAGTGSDHLPVLMEFDFK